jgi:glycosyltransferase involved in cell wall biosynthesis
VSDDAAVTSAGATSIAVAIPCHNEAAAIEQVIASWRRALPEANIVVFDNNSTDGTGDRARAMSVEVVLVPEQGKGFAVRKAFEHLLNDDLLILTDGDGTYPPDQACNLLAPIRDDIADMVVGARRPVAELGAMSPLRGIGNKLIRASFRVLIGRAPGDLLSGYRAFNRRFRETVELASRGFEIEAELSAEAIGFGLRVVEIPVPYHPRIEGTHSKLRAVRDGLRIMRMIGLQSLRLTPWRPVAIAALVAAFVSIPLVFWPGIGCAAALAIEAVALWWIHHRRIQGATIDADEPSPESSTTTPDLPNP